MPFQDVISAGADARMNTPGQPSGNWTWRFTADAFDHDGKEKLAHITWLFQRRPDQQEKVYGDVAVKKD